MPNPNYVKGRKKEYAEMHEAKERGCLVIRSAGSHGPVDLVIVHPFAKIIEFVQCKPDDISEDAKNHILDDNRELNGDFRVYFKVK